MAVPVSAKGVAVPYAGHLWYGGSIEDDEPTPELRWPMSVQVYDAMSNQESQVASVLRAVWLPVRRTTWRLDGSGCSDHVTSRVAEDLGLSIMGKGPNPARRARDRFSFAEHLRLALLMHRYGHSYFEQVYRPDGREYRLRKLMWLPPRTLSAFNVAADGGLSSIEQDASKNGPLEVARLVAYVNEREGGNWLGRSMLRSAYKYWLLKDQMLRVGAQTVRRNGMGVPIYTAGPEPEGLSPEELVARETAEMEAGLKLAQDFRSGEAAGASIRNGASLRLAGVDGRLPDALPWVRYYDEQTARAVLAHFLNLGGDNSTGSYALGDTFADFFASSLQSVAQDFADTFNQHVIEDLVDVNWGPDEPAPRLVFDEIGARHPATADAIRSLVDSGVITPDEALEAHMRMTYGLPLADPNTARQRAGTGGIDG